MFETEKRVIFTLRNMTATASKKYFKMNDEIVECLQNSLNLYKESKK